VQRNSGSAAGEPWRPKLDALPFVSVRYRHLRLRDRAVRAGLVQHNCLFFTDSGAPIKHLGYGHWV